MTKNTLLLTLKHILDLFCVNTFRPLDGACRNIDDYLTTNVKQFFSQTFSTGHV